MGHLLERSTVSFPAFPPQHAGLPEGYDSWDAYYDDLERWREDDATRGLQAMRLAPTLAVYRALLNGEDVPADALDQKWRKRYGL